MNTNLWADVWAIEVERNRKLKSLLDRIGKEALSKTLILDIEGVPGIHSRRVLIVNAQDYKDATDLGFSRLFGLDLVLTS